MANPSKDGRNRNMKRRQCEAQKLRKALAKKNISKKELKKLRQSHKVKTVVPQQPQDDLLVVRLTDMKSFLSKKNVHKTIGWLVDLKLNELSQRALFVGADLVAACDRLVGCKKLFSNFVDAFISNCKHYGFNRESDRAFYMILHASIKNSLLSKSQCGDLVVLYLEAIKNRKFNLRDFASFVKDASVLLEPMHKTTYLKFVAAFLARTDNPEKINKYSSIATQILASSKNVRPRVSQEELKSIVKTLYLVFHQRLTAYEMELSNQHQLISICSHSTMLLNAMNEWTGILERTIKQQYASLFERLKQRIKQAEVEPSYFVSLCLSSEKIFE